MTPVPNIHSVPNIHRRTLFSLLGGVLAGPRFGRAPAIVRQDTGRPAIPCGVASGDVTATRATIWSRTDRPARMVVEYDTTDTFTNVRRVTGPAALETSDFTARTELVDVPSGQRVFYRVRFQDLSDLRTWSDPVVGSFRTPASADGPASDVRLAWSADTVGQGWGINPDFGGLRLYETMRAFQPDAFLQLGDNIYADQPLQAAVTLDDGSIWKNVVTEAKSKVAQTLDDFWGCYRYNLLDEHMRRFAADVPQMWLWDDHEVKDNWFLGKPLTADDRYQVKSMALLAARAQRAFLDYAPIRISDVEPERVYRSYRLGPMVELFALDLRKYRGPNTPNLQTTLDAESAILGPDQLAWLKRALRASGATWKIIASDLPLGLVVRDFPSDFEAVANANDGPPLGRELEIADLLADMKRSRVRNVIWLTADVHYAAAHHYDPARARFTNFDPFWEFVAGPLNAGTFGPNALDATFGPKVMYLAIPDGMKPNRPPSAGLQFFGSISVAARTRVLTARLHNLAGDVLYTVNLDPTP
ncbi:MAG: alkaline phosphatase D family protein [Vicinamibacterales bacterium]